MKQNSSISSKNSGSPLTDEAIKLSKYKHKISKMKEQIKQFKKTINNSNKLNQSLQQHLTDLSMNY